MNVLILTAGLGTRLRPVTEHIAKPAVPFLNLPMVGYSLFCAEILNPTRVIFNTFHCPETIRTAVDRLAAKTSYEVIFSHEEPFILGRGGAIKKVESQLIREDHFLLLNGDSLNLFQDVDVLKIFWQTHLESDAIATLLLTPFDGDRAGRSAVWVNSEGLVKAFGPNVPGPDLKPFHFPGVQAISSEIIRDMPSGEFDIFYDTFVNLIAQGERIESFVVEEILSFETGNVKDYFGATEACLKLIDLNRPGAHGRQILRTLARFNVQFELQAGRILLGEAAKVEINLGGFCVIGERCKLRGKGHLRNCVVLADVDQTIDRAIDSELIYR